MLRRSYRLNSELRAHVELILENKHFKFHFKNGDYKFVNYGHYLSQSTTPNEFSGNQRNERIKMSFDFKIHNLIFNFYLNIKFLYLRGASLTIEFYYVLLLNVFPSFAAKAGE